eukprot:TRINITY_DN18363_c2_g2_i1.p2 TRINITY_DN18363_c2_g2~~TRINITY_DN18363_c2_g2_i1.p2  ORF type:complete len:455 (+),score=138.66 TRINITY_DN18363_c2_g2_i1:98-1462(+)
MEHLGLEKDSEVEVHIAPMIDVTNRYFRSFMRLLSSRAIVWTEMIKDDAILHNLHDPTRLEWLLGHCPEESRLVFQLGGSDPAKLADAAAVVAEWGYDEINLNVGCPSSRVCDKGEFGARLMLAPETVRDCVYQMQRRVAPKGVPVTVKTRLGVDDHDTPEFTKHFVDTVAGSGCTRFYMHARKAWLSGLSPAQNRTIPPLDYGRVRWLCNERPDLSFVLNGGLNTMAQCKEELAAAPSNLVGVMLGRAAMNHPATIAEVDPVLFGDARRENFHRYSMLNDYIGYLAQRVPPAPLESKVVHGTLPRNSAGLCGAALKPAVNIFADFPGAKQMAKQVELHLRSQESCNKGPAYILRDSLESMAQRYPAVVQHPFGAPLRNPNMLRNPKLRDKDHMKLIEEREERLRRDLDTLYEEGNLSAGVATCTAPPIDDVDDAAEAEDSEQDPGAAPAPSHS